ncbi:MAG: HD domain-containing protein [Planctomycetes bacterium]|nr:HD domain-containing protein [Planctomycetota bacterium]
MFRCPGQDQRFWKPDDIFEVECPDCGKTIEFFKDEPKLKCRKCGAMVINPKIDLGCAEWCQYAEQCLGVTFGADASVLRDKLIAEMKKVFGRDTKRIDHALSVLNYAEQIQQAEGGDPLIVKAAAILHDIGILEAEKKHGSAAGKFQEIEGPAIAEGILKRHNVADDAIEHICKIIANHHSAKDINTKEFQIIWDADWLVNLPEEYHDKSDEDINGAIDKNFKTNKGRQLAKELFIKS